MGEDNALVPTIAAPPTLTVRRDARMRFEPQNLGELLTWAETIAGSDLVPKEYRGKPEDIIIAAQMGSTVGFNCGQSLQGIAVVNGRATIWGDAMLGLCLASPLCVEIEEDNPTDIEEKESATCIAHRVNRKPVVRTFSKADAERAHLWTKKGPWATNPWRMLQMRARSFACRDQFADILRGLSMREEVEDYQLNTQPPLKVVLPKMLGVTEESVLNIIASATNTKQLEKAAVQGAQLPDQSKAKVREAYKERVAQLRTVDVAPQDIEPNR
jgi:hypothetical protein